MNITTDQYIEGLENSVRELPALLDRWPSIDDELREEYSEQLSWLLRVRREAIANAAANGRGFEIACRIARATSAMTAFADRLETFMGIGSADLLQESA